MERLGTLPFVAQPGEAYVYGYNTDILGCVVEKASGMPLDQFVRSRITEPLHLKDTRFFIPAGERERLAAVYSSGPDGKIVRAVEGSKGQGHYVDGPRKSFAGGAGLTSTARDYARFLEMIRSGGALDGVRILAPQNGGADDDQSIGHAALHDRTGIRVGIRDGGPVRRERDGRGRRVRLGRGVWDVVSGGPSEPDGNRVHAAVDAQCDGHTAEVHDIGVSGSGELGGRSHITYEVCAR